MLSPVTSHLVYDDAQKLSSRGGLAQQQQQQQQQHFILHRTDYSFIKYR